MAARTARKYTGGLCLTLAALLVLYHVHSPCHGPQQHAVMVASQQYVVGRDTKNYTYDRLMPLIFIGGMPRSGTTLLRVLLDAHPDIRCGEETRVIPRVLGLRHQWTRAPMESKRLQEAGISGQVLDSAVGAFILEVIARHGSPALRLCNKDPFTLKSAVYLQHLFPNAKFLLLLRDGRAVVHSIISRKVAISGLDLTDYRQCLKKWNAAMKAMYSQCQQLGPSICLPVYYERLVLHPRPSLQRILDFLDVAWNESVMHHDQFVEKPGVISLSMLERSTDQVIKPINLEALTKWVGNIPEDVVNDMPSIAPMLGVLGYDPRANPPKYGEPDSFVLHNHKAIQANQKVWDAKTRAIEKNREILRKSAFQKFKIGDGSGKATITDKAKETHSEGDSGDKSKDTSSSTANATTVS